MKKEEIISLLKDCEPEHAERFAAYCIRLLLEIDKKKGGRKNLWIQKRTSEQMAVLFKRVNKEGLVFDGEDITLLSTGISYNYQAYKNRMLLAYPESLIDVDIVFREDKFTARKENGKVFYSHEIADPFNDKDADIVGTYCVIRNKRGEFLVRLSPDEIEKHRKVAKTDYIWRQWFKEMVRKTVIKKACGAHFKDIYKGIEDADNENYNLENPLELDIDHKAKIDAITSVEELKDYWTKNKGIGKEFDKYISMRKQQLSSNTQ